MSSVTMHAHDKLAAASHDIRHTNRTKNMHRWVTTTHPHALTATNPTRIPAGYLADLYPNIWRWGPRGDTYATQLDIILGHLNAIADGNTNQAFIDATTTAFTNLPHLYNDRTVIYNLIKHASGAGLPVPGFDLLGLTDNDPLNPVEYIRNHVLWMDAGGYPEHADAFEDALYRFSLISLHGILLADLHGTLPNITAVINTYNTFCHTWDIPI